MCTEYKSKTGKFSKKRYKCKDYINFFELKNKVFSVFFYLPGEGLEVTNAL